MLAKASIPFNPILDNVTKRYIYAYTNLHNSETTTLTEHIKASVAHILALNVHSPHSIVSII